MLKEIYYDFESLLSAYGHTDRAENYKALEDDIDRMKFQDKETEHLYGC